MSLPLPELVHWLDTGLKINEIKDYPASRNGLQLENRSGSTTRVVAAVDASAKAIAAAVERGADLLIVHHGLFWTGIEPLTGPAFAKISCAIEGNLAIYSAHLPLDLHPTWGNNSLLARALGFDPEQARPLTNAQGAPFGLIVDASQFHREELRARIAEAVAGPVHLCPGGPEQVGQLAIVTGGAGSEAALVRAAGADSFLTGEGPHWSFPLAQELGLNLFYAGHYATETFGVKALTAAVAAQFNLENLGFIDLPSGL